MGANFLQGLCTAADGMDHHNPLLALDSLPPFIPSSHRPSPEAKLTLVGEVKSESCSLLAPSLEETSCTPQRMAGTRPGYKLLRSWLAPVAFLESLSAPSQPWTGWALSREGWLYTLQKGTHLPAQRG